MGLMTIQIGQEHHPCLVVVCRCLEDMARQRHRRCQDRGVTGAISDVECVQCSSSSWGDGIEDAEQSMTIAPLVATDQLRIIEVITGIHAYHPWQAPPHPELAACLRTSYLDPLGL